MSDMKRRDLFRAGGAAMAGLASAMGQSAGAKKKVIVCFWKTDKISTNWVPPDPRLNELWSMADEVNTPRGILLGGAQAGVDASASLPAFQELYPGKSADIEQVIVHDWPKDPWAGMCERISYRPGELARFWPEMARPCGGIHFAGAYSAQMSWGQEAALESANRVAAEIDRA